MNEIISNKVKEMVQKILGDEYNVIYKKITKNNGTKYNAIIINNNNNNLCPTFYIDCYINKYKTPEIVASVIVKEYFDCINNSQNEINNINNNMKKLFKYDFVKDKLILQLINKESNKELLKSVPYKEFLDLAIIVRIVVHREDKEGIVRTIILDNSLYKCYNVDFRQILKDAENNMEYDIEGMFELFAEAEINRLKCFGDLSEEEETEILKRIKYEYEKGNALTPGMYVVTTKNHMNGAIAITSEKVMQSVLEKLNTDKVIVAPSSVHECLVMTYDEKEKNLFTNELVESVNEESVEETEILSNNTYIYDKKYGWKIG